MKLSVVMPVRNGEETLSAQLDALVAARDPGVPFEVVVADNGSTDATVAIVESYVDRLPIRVVDASREPGINVARNSGVAAAEGDWLTFCDADDEVDQSWLSAVASAFGAGHQLIGGPIDYCRLNPPEVRAWRGTDRSSVMTMHGFLPSAHGANFAVRRDLFDRLGGFDEAFVHGGDDIEFMWRAQLAGAELHEEPDAVVHYRLRPSLRAHWRQYASYGVSESLLYERFASEGMSRRPPSAWGRDMWWLASRLPFAVSMGRRGAWLRRGGQQWGRLKGAVRHRILWW